jgi:hypothetical protein
MQFRFHEDILRRSSPLSRMACVLSSMFPGRENV